MLEFLNEPWPWYVAGPLFGLMVPLLLVFGNKPFGISSSLRHVCAICVPMKINYFRYNWKEEQWNLFFVGGVLIGGFLAHRFMGGDHQIAISQETVSDLTALGLTDFNSYLPREIFGWEHLLSVRGFVFMVFGGFLIGFGTRYANGCTSGHSITGMANFQFGSLIATISFFAGGLIMTYFILPYLM